MAQDTLPSTYVRNDPHSWRYDTSSRIFFATGKVAATSFERPMAGVVVEVIVHASKGVLCFNVQGKGRVLMPVDLRYRGTQEALRPFAVVGGLSSVTISSCFVADE